MWLTKNEGSLTRNEGEWACWYPVQTPSWVPFTIKSELIQVTISSLPESLPILPVSSTSLSAMAILRTCILSRCWPFDMRLKYPVSYLPTKCHSHYRWAPMLVSHGNSPACPHPQHLAKILLRGLFPRLPKPIYYEVSLELTCNDFASSLIL